MAKKTQRLWRQEWIDAGFHALVAKGAQGLGVEPIATDLGMTEGSF
ncbi:MULTISPECIES: hypothetical protein [unclassified Yoonia]|nr:MULTISPECIES: hypothetical protein [unclassified Yoonia]